MTSDMEKRYNSMISKRNHLSIASLLIVLFLTVLFGVNLSLSVVLSISISLAVFMLYTLKMEDIKDTYHFKG